MHTNRETKIGTAALCTTFASVGCNVVIEANMGVVNDAVRESVVSTQKEKNMFKCTTLRI